MLTCPASELFIFYTQHSLTVKPITECTAIVIYWEKQIYFPHTRIWDRSYLKSSLFIAIWQQYRFAWNCIAEYQNTNNIIIAGD